MALADGTYDKDTDYGEPNGFIDLRMTGKMAEHFSADCIVGTRVAVTGRLDWSTFKKKDGTEGKSLTVTLFGKAATALVGILRKDDDGTPAGPDAPSGFAAADMAPPSEDASGFAPMDDGDDMELPF